MVWILNGWKTSPVHKEFQSDLEGAQCGLFCSALIACNA